VKSDSRLERLYKDYTAIREWYLNLSPTEEEAVKKYDPDLIAAVEFVIKLVEGDEKIKNV